MHPIYCDIYFVLPSAFDILRYILSCRAIAIYDLSINLRYNYKRVSPLKSSQTSQYWNFESDTNFSFVLPKVAVCCHKLLEVAKKLQQKLPYVAKDWVTLPNTAKVANGFKPLQQCNPVLFFNG